jgi:hypothetical protein
VGSIYRHNEGGAPLAVAECAHKLGGFRTALVDGIRGKFRFLFGGLGSDVWFVYGMLFGFVLIDVSFLAFAGFRFGR